MNNQTADMTLGGVAMKVGATYEYTFQGLVDPDPANHKARFTVTGIDPVKGTVDITWQNGNTSYMFAGGRHPIVKDDPDCRILTEVSA